MSNLADEMFADSDSGPNQQQLEGVQEMANRLLAAIAEAEAIEEQLKQANEVVRRISMEELPELMGSVGMKEFTLEDGTKLKVTDVVQGSLPKDNLKKQVAIRWLVDNGHEGLIKDFLAAQFEKGQGEIAEKFLAAMLKEGVNAERDRTVHPQTLAAFAREQLANSVDVPLETLGLWSGKKVRVTKPKKG